MKRNRVALKLGLTIFLIVLILFIPYSIILEGVYRNYYINQTKTNLLQLSERYAEMLSTPSTMLMHNMLPMMAQFTNTDAVLINTQGIIIQNSGVPSYKVGTPISRDELFEMQQGKVIESLYTDPETNHTFFMVGRPTFKMKQFSEAILIFSPINGVERSIRYLQRAMLLTGFITILVAIGLILFFTRTLSRPLVIMEKATKQIAKGDLDTRVNLFSGDEIGSLAQAINELAMDLKKYRDNRNEFFANISHELRTPMTYLDGYANVLKNGLYESEEEKQQYLQIIMEETKRLRVLIDDLFDLSKMEEGKFPLNMEWVDIAEIVQQAVKQVKPKAAEKGIHMKLKILDSLPLFYGDGLRMQQIMLNLLDNAIRYTEHGEINTAIRIVDQEFRITVRDTGIGMEPDQLRSIFDRFYRVEPSRSRALGGSGLGLAIVEKLVLIQGGTIEVESELGKGTAFHLRFKVEDKRDK